MIEVTFMNKYDFLVDEAALREAVRVVLYAHKRLDGQALSIVFDVDDGVAVLNEAYRGIAAPTDVLSFPAEPMPPEIPVDEVYLGDLVIAYPYTKAQAAKDGHDLGDMLRLLVVHGTLHLLGYDHDTPENRAVMWQAQAHALAELGISPEIVPALETSAHGDE